MDELDDRQRQMLFLQVPNVHPFEVLCIGERFRLIRHTPQGFQQSNNPLRKWGTDWAHQIRGGVESNGVQIDPGIIVKVDPMILARGSKEIAINNTGWNQIVSLAWDNGWCPALPVESRPTETGEHYPLHVHFESVTQVEDEDARSLAESLCRVGSIPAEYNRITAEQVADIAELARAGAFEVR